MKLLVDNQLPAALARFLAERGLVCRHVCALGLDACDDRILAYLSVTDYLAWVAEPAGDRLLIILDAWHLPLKTPRRSA